MHKHPYPRSIHVLEGTLTLTAEGGHPHSYPVGSFVVEAVDVWHTGSNIGTTPTTILMIDEVPTAQV